MLAMYLAACATTQNPPNTPQPLKGPLTEQNHSPYAITVGPDGNIWFTEFQGSNIGMMTPGGDVMKFAIAPDGFAERVANGPDGAVWFTDTRANRIGRITSDGKIKYVKLPQADSGPTGITAGSDGFIYFSEHGSNRIGRLRTDGNLTEFTLAENSGPAEMVLGHDGLVYFVEDGSGKIGKIDHRGAISEVSIPTPNAIPSAIASGPDGSIYFAELGPGKIGKMNLSGVINEYKLPEGKPLGLATGPDGNLWATIPRDHVIYRMTSGGNFIAYRALDRVVPAYIAGSSDGNLYFTEPNGKIGRINTNGDVTEFDTLK